MIALIVRGTLSNRHFLTSSTIVLYIKFWDQILLTSVILAQMGHLIWFLLTFFNILSKHRLQYEWRQPSTRGSTNVSRQSEHSNSSNVLLIFSAKLVAIVLSQAKQQSVNWMSVHAKENEIRSVNLHIESETYNLRFKKPN